MILVLEVFRTITTNVGSRNFFVFLELFVTFPWCLCDYPSLMTEYDVTMLNRQNNSINHIHLMCFGFVWETIWQIKLGHSWAKLGLRTTDGFMMTIGQASRSHSEITLVWWSWGYGSVLQCWCPNAGCI